MEILEVFDKFFNQAAFLNWVTLIGYMVIVFYAANLLSDTSNRVLNSVGAYKPNGIKAYIGVPIHEFGHWMFAKLFRFKVTDAKFFPTKPTDNGNGRITLGYVSYSVSSNTNILIRAFGLMLVSVGPIFSGSFVIIVLGKLLCNDMVMACYRFIQGSFKTEESALGYIAGNFGKLLSLFKNELSIRYIVFMILAIIIADFMTLSGPDLKNFYKGVIILTVAVFVASFVPVCSDKLGWLLGVCVSFITFFGVLSLLGQIVNLCYSLVYRVVKREVVRR